MLQSADNTSSRDLALHSYIVFLRCLNWQQLADNFLVNVPVTPADKHRIDGRVEPDSSILVGCFCSRTVTRLYNQLPASAGQVDGQDDNGLTS